MKSFFKLTFAGMGTLCLLVLGCNQSATTKVETPPTPQVNPVSKEVGAAPTKAGSYCFVLKEDGLNIEGRLELTADRDVEGNLKGHLNDQKTHQDQTYDTSFRGRIVGDSLHLTVLSNESGARQETKETWAWKKEGLQQGKNLLKVIDCPN